MALDWAKCNRLGSMAGSEIVLSPFVSSDILYAGCLLGLFSLCKFYHVVSILPPVLAAMVVSCHAPGIPTLSSGWFPQPLVLLFVLSLSVCALLSQLDIPFVVSWGHPSWAPAVTLYPLSGVVLLSHPEVVGSGGGSGTGDGRLGGDVWLGLPCREDPAKTDLLCRLLL